MIACPVCKSDVAGRWTDAPNLLCCRCKRLWFVPNFGRTDGQFRFYCSASPVGAAGASDHLVLRWNGLHEFALQGPLVRVAPEFVNFLLSKYMDAAFASFVLEE